MPLTRTFFDVDIAGQHFKIAALSLREFQRFQKAEEQAVEAKDLAALDNVRLNVVALALKNAGMDISEDDVAESLSRLMLNSLYLAIVEANGMKLSAKVGEASASQSA
jgi:hypothetical protein